MLSVLTAFWGPLIGRSAAIHWLFFTVRSKKQVFFYLNKC